MIDTMKILNDILKDREMSLYALSKLSGISYSTFDTAKRRGGQLTIDTIEKICEALNIPVYEFFMTDSDWDDIAKYILENRSLL